MVEWMSNSIIKMHIAKNNHVSHFSPIPPWWSICLGYSSKHPFELTGIKFTKCVMGPLNSLLRYYHGCCTAWAHCIFLETEFDKMDKFSMQSSASSFRYSSADQLQGSGVHQRWWIHHHTGAVRDILGSVQRRLDRGPSPFWSACKFKYLNQIFVQYIDFKCLQ